METLFNYLASLGVEEGIKYFILLCLTLALLPYYEIIAKYGKQLIIRKELKIVYFKHATAPFVGIGKDSKGQALYGSHNNENLLICNSILNFVWQVEGAIRVDLLPIGNKLKGNAASVIIDSNVKKYTLVAHGFKGDKKESIIDFSESIFYKIHTEPLASNQVVFRDAPEIKATSYHNVALLNRNYTKSKLNNLKYWFRSKLYDVETKNISTDFLVAGDSKRKSHYKNIEQFKILKSYTFSTKKYQSLK